jgi:DNA-binding FadR family transcriptional regulator
LVNAIKQFQRRVFRYGYLTISIPGHAEKYISIHRKMIEALINKNSNSAEQFMKGHLMEVRDILAD